DLIPRADAAALADRLDAIAAGDDAVRARNDRVYAVRNLMSMSDDVRQLAQTTAVRGLAQSIVGPGARVVRAIPFDKSPASNWKVAWHQDLSIAVRERADVPGYGPWSVKAGVPHVQPPADLLGRMVTVRVHLDDCGEANGPLQVLPGSHAAGALSPEQVADWRGRVPPVPCLVPAGGAVVMRPLILHASSPATAAGRRRVVHLEWSADELPGGLAWDVE
ncbi:MAG TPA: phytanoyl-CoA dioxygenase family protein, partial [Humisphaera sp.]